MSRRIKVRAWDTEKKKYLYSEKQDFICTTHSDGLGVTIPYHKDIPSFGVDNFDEDCFDWADADLLMGRYELEEFTGCLDKNGKEIYENCELDGRYIVEYIAPKFIAKDMLSGDIIDLYENKFTVTREHCEVSQNSERSIN